MKRMLTVALAALLAVSTLSGCYGNFALTRKLYHANGQVGDKFLRSGLTWVLVILPVYGIAALVDFVILNTIEFWSGTNPALAAEKDFQFAQGDDSFRIHARKSGDFIDYTIQHYNKTGLVDTTRISWDSRNGTSVVSTNKDNADRQFVVSKDEGKFRIDQYADSRLQDVSWYTPAGSGAAEQFAAAR